MKLRKIQVLALLFVILFINLIHVNAISVKKTNKGKSNLKKVHQDDNEENTGKN